MVKKKSKSKRLTLHKKYKIARKVREHKRQERKKAKAGLLHNKRKDPGIPNSWPFKEELLQQVEQARLAELDAKQQAKEARKLEKKQQQKLQQKQRAQLTKLAALTPQAIELQAKKDIKSSIQKADLVVMVLDARDPQGSRALSLEDGLIAKGHKQLLLVLNKIDLVPRENAQKWLNYLRRFHPTIAVHALNKSVTDVKHKSRNLKSQEAFYNRSQQLEELRDNGNVECLRLFLQRFSATAKESSVPLKVALVGYPNVGKSTLLNSIKRKQLAQVSGKANSTKRAHEIAFNDKLVLIDTPPLDVSYSASDSVILRHGIAELFMDDPVPEVAKLLERAEPVKLMQTLGIAIYNDHEDFLKKLAVKQHLLRKSGEPDVLLMARTFLRNLGNGTYATSCVPPSKTKSRFEMPSWFAQLKLLQDAAFVDEEAKLWSVQVAQEVKKLTRTIVFHASTESDHVTGDTTEYDLVCGTLPECDGLSSEEEDNDDDDDDDDDEQGEDEDEDENVNKAKRAAPAATEDDEEVQDQDQEQQQEQLDEDPMTPQRKNPRRAARPNGSMSDTKRRKSLRMS